MQMVAGSNPAVFRLFLPKNWSLENMHGLHEISEKTRWPIPDINSRTNSIWTCVLHMLFATFFICYSLQYHKILWNIANLNWKIWFDDFFHLWFPIFHASSHWCCNYSFCQLYGISNVHFIACWIEDNQFNCKNDHLIHYSRCFCSFLVHKKFAIKSFLEMHLKCKFYNGLLLGLEIHGQNSLGKVVSRHQIPPWLNEINQFLFTSIALQFHARFWEEILARIF